MRAGGEIDLLDFYPDFLSESFRSFAPLGRLFEIANALVGPVERQYECRHGLSLLDEQKQTSPLPRQVDLGSFVQGRRCCQTGMPADGPIAAHSMQGENVGAFPVKGQLVEV